MILEGMVTSLNERGELNVAPMGPVVDESMTQLRLRPFQSSCTFQNLQIHPEGVFHVVDDVLLLARAAIGRLESEPCVTPAHVVKGRVLADACRWYEFRIESCDVSGPRAEMLARVVHVGRIRDFFGFNRAKHAVLEAAILATRLHILPPDQVQAELSRLRVPVEKTAGPREQEAFQLLEQYIREHSGVACAP